MRAGIYRWLFLISIGINVALGILLFQTTRNRPTKASNEQFLLTRNPGPPRGIESAPAAHSDFKRFDWKSVESADYKTYLANLRAAGCPEETIRDIIRADVTKLYDEKKRAVRKESPKFEVLEG